MIGRYAPLALIACAWILVGCGIGRNAPDLRPATTDSRQTTASTPSDSTSDQSAKDDPASLMLCQYPKNL